MLYDFSFAYYIKLFYLTDKLRKENEHIKAKYKNADRIQKQLQQQLDTAHIEVSRLRDENPRITKEIESFDGITLGNYCQEFLFSSLFSTRSVLRILLMYVSHQVYFYDATLSINWRN